MIAKREISDEALKEALVKISVEQVLERVQAIETIESAGTRGLEGLARLLRTGTEREKAITLVQLPRMFYQRAANEYSQAAFDDLQVVFQDSPSAQFRRRLLRVIENLLWLTKDREAHKQIFFALWDDDSLIRQSAVLFVSRHKLVEAIPYLSLLLDDEAEMVRKAARSSLESYKMPEASFAVWDWDKRRKR